MNSAASLSVEGTRHRVQPFQHHHACTRCILETAQLRVKLDLDTGEARYAATTVQAYKSKDMCCTAVLGANCNCHARACPITLIALSLAFRTRSPVVMSLAAPICRVVARSALPGNGSVNIFLTSLLSTKLEICRLPRQSGTERTNPGKRCSDVTLLIEALRAADQIRAQSRCG